MLRTQPFAGQRGINHQRVVSMDKGLFAPGLPARRSQTAENDIHRVNHLRQGIGQLGIVRIKTLPPAPAGDASGRRWR
jgi:hypothetical protein